MNSKSVNNIATFPSRIRIRRGLAFGIIIVGALIAFEAFNYSTTEYALNDLLGDLGFLSIKWATILAIAFCGIDFAGVARLFTPEEGENEPTEVWYLFGAWLLAATMNAMLTWWGVSQAIINNQAVNDAILTRSTIIRVVPIFVAILVWLIRVLIIGTFSVAGDRLFSQKDNRDANTKNKNYTAQDVYSKETVNNLSSTPSRSSVSPTTFRPAPKTTNQIDPIYSKAGSYSQSDLTTSSVRDPNINSQSVRTFNARSGTNNR
jgi:hypothetical protein